MSKSYVSPPLHCELCQKPVPQSYYEPKDCFGYRAKFHRWFWYMVIDEVWEEANLGAYRQICLRCLRSRLTRDLVVGDFNRYSWLNTTNSAIVRFIAKELADYANGNDAALYMIRSVKNV